MVECAAMKRKRISFETDQSAPLPLLYTSAVRKAVELRARGAVWTWPVIADVMRIYHGVDRTPAWWASQVKDRDPSAARPRGVPLNGHQ